MAKVKRIKKSGKFIDSARSAAITPGVIGLLVQAFGWERFQEALKPVAE